MKDNIFSKLFLYLLIVVFSIITIIFTVKNHIILALITYLIIIFISLKKDIKRFPVILFIISLIIRLILVKIINFSSFDDYKTLIDASWMFSKGDYSFSNTTYFSMWGYQTGLVIYQGIILKIFKSEFILKVFNSIFSSLIVLLVYFISKKLTNEKSARVSLLYMILPISLIMNTMLNNQILSALLMYLGIYRLIKKEKNIKDYVISAILISLGNIIRPEGIVVVFSLLVFELIKLKKETVLDVIKKVSVFIIIYFIIGRGLSSLVQISGINEVGLKNTNPLWKFVVGFNHDSCGYYNSSDEKYIQDKQLEKKIIKQRITSDYKKTSKLMICKIEHFWLLPEENSKSESLADKEYIVFSHNFKYSTLENIALKFNSYIYIITLIMCFIGVIFNRKKLMEDNSIFFVILMVTTFFVYLLIEINSKYIFFILISIFILSSYGYDYVLNKIKLGNH